MNPINKSVDTIPKIICLNQLVNVKRIDSLSNESIKMKINYVKISESFLWTLEGIEVEIDLISGNELYLILNENLSKLKDRPRNLLVFVNPICGKGKEIYLFK